MKGLSDAAFFRVFDMLAGEGNPGLKMTGWDYAGLRWCRDRYSVLNPGYSFTIETFLITHPGRPHWTLLVAKEYWWGANEHKTLRNTRWARPTEGRHADVLAWFRGQEHSRASKEEAFSGRAS
jgi:hypothetical protein